MRVVSLPQSAYQASVERPGAHSRDRTPVEGGAVSRKGGKEDAANIAATLARIPRRYLEADPALTGIGLTAQNMFHSENSGPAEHSIVRATRAYAEIDNMRFRATPFSYRVT